MQMLACSNDESPFKGTGTSGGSTPSGGGGGAGGVGVTIGFGNLTNESHFTIADSIVQANSIRLSEDGNTIVFVSSQDLTGSNFDEVNQVFSIINGTMTQVTNFTTATDDLGSSAADLNNVKFMFSGDGSTLIWIGSTSNEIFISDLSGSITQLTSLSVNDFNNIDISNDGSTAIFTSFADLDTGQNSSFTLQIFAINTVTMAITQVTPATSFGSIINTLRISGDGASIAFTSTDDWLAGGPAQDTQVFTINTDRSGLTQQTSATEDHESVRISNDGATVVFYSTGDLTGSNTAGISEVFSVDTATQVITQQTTNRNVPVAGTLGSDFYDLSGDGTQLIYADGDGANNPISLKSVDIATSVSTTILQTDSATGASFYVDHPFTNVDGTISAFASNYNYNLTLTGEINEQIYSHQ